MSYPECPHCSFMFDNEHIYQSGGTEFPTESDGQESDTNCANCKEPLKIILNLTPSWSFVNEDYDEIF